MLEDVSKIICGACGGKCCEHFTVFVEDEFGRLLQNPTFYDPISDITCLMVNTPNFNFESHNFECYYYSKGGCPEELKPDVCRDWFCSIWDEFVLGEVKPLRIGSQSKWITRRILRGLRDC